MNYWKADIAVRFMPEKVDLHKSNNTVVQRPGRVPNEKVKSCGPLLHRPPLLFGRYSSSNTPGLSQCGSKPYNQGADSSDQHKTPGCFKSSQELIEPCLPSSLISEQQLYYVLRQIYWEANED